MTTSDRLAGRFLIAVVMILLATACGGGAPSAPTPPGTANASDHTTGSGSAVAYSACMRAHGIPAFADPGPDGRVPKASAKQLGVGDAQLRVAQQACRSVYPVNARGYGASDTAFRRCEETGDCPQALVQQAMTQLRLLSRCMRRKGLVRFPDPVIDTQGRPELYIRPWRDGFDPDSSRFANTEKDCESVMHPFFTPPLAIYLRGNN